MTGLGKCKQGGNCAGQFGQERESESLFPRGGTGLSGHSEALGIVPVVDVLGGDEACLHVHGSPVYRGAFRRLVYGGEAASLQELVSITAANYYSFAMFSIGGWSRSGTSSIRSRPLRFDA